MTIEITVNGDKREVSAPLSVAGLLDQFGIHQRLVVVEINGDIVRRDAYDQTPVEAGNALEIVQMMAGG